MKLKDLMPGMFEYRGKNYKYFNISQLNQLSNDQSFEKLMELAVQNGLSEDTEIEEAAEIATIMTTRKSSIMRKYDEVFDGN